MQNYRYNSTLTTSVKDEEVQAWFNKNLKANAQLATKVTEAIALVVDNQKKQAAKAVHPLSKEDIEFIETNIQVME